MNILVWNQVSIGKTIETFLPSFECGQNRFHLPILQIDEFGTGSISHEKIAFWNSQSVFILS